MRAFISGAGGFVGHHLLEHLLVNTDWDIVCTDSFRHKGKTNRINEVLHSHEFEAPRVQVITHDLTAPFSKQTVNAIGGIDFIFNVASESHVDRSITEPVTFIENNVALVLNMLELARQVQPGVFIQVSTDEVYGPAYGTYRHKEWDPIIPSNPYSASKAAQEAIATAYWRTFDVPVVITNTMNIIGERQDPEKFVPMTIKKVFTGETVTIHASPTRVIGSRFYLHARNQADALMYLATYFHGEPIPLYTNGADRPAKFHVVGDVEVNNLDMAQLIAKYADKQLNYTLEDFHSSRPGHDLRYALNGHLLSMIGWKAPIPFEESLKRTVEWTLEHPEWLLED